MAAAKKEQNDFVSAVYTAAKSLWEKRDSINPVFVTAQAAIETGWRLNADGTNNLFGITKGSRWTGEVKLCLTTEYFNIPNKRFTAPEDVLHVEKVNETRYKYRVYRLFRVYPDLESCLNDHLEVLRGAHYADAWPYRHDAREYARRIAGRYATSPDYGKLLETVIGQVEKMIDN